MRVRVLPSRLALIIEKSEHGVAHGVGINRYIMRLHDVIML